MSNYYSTATACSGVPATSKEFKQLEQLLRTDDPEGDPSEEVSHGFELDYFEKSAYLKAPEFCNHEALPEKFCKALGKLLKKNKMDFLQVGVAFTCDRARVDSHGGYYFRILPDGRVVEPKPVWPK